MGLFGKKKGSPRKGGGDPVLPDASDDGGGAYSPDPSPPAGSGEAAEERFLFMYVI